VGLVLGVAGHVEPVPRPAFAVGRRGEQPPDDALVSARPGVADVGRYRDYVQDVLHDLWIPELGLKTDLVPGRENVIRVYTGRAGTYDGVCAEFCGLEHAWMRFRIVAEPRAAYDRWVAGQAAARATPAASAADGERVFLANVCVSCHAVRGTSASATIGPELTHLASRARLAGGVLPNDPAALRSWLEDPQRYKPGAFMPQVKLAPSDLDALVAYLAALR